MAMPRLGQYQLALQHPATAFADLELKRASVEITPIGLPRVISGGFALTYHLSNGRAEWAVRCFHREATALRRRYEAISALVAKTKAGPFVPVLYQERGVLVEGAWYPLTKMPWLNAVPLNRAIESALDRKTLTRQAQQFRSVVEKLASLGVAHGDLQHGNILVDAFGNMKLVDYDGMFVPALAGLGANESGHVNYQHRERSGQFDALLDRFSAAMIYTALVALAADPSLWHRHSNGENLLFRRADLDDPVGSPLFQELQALRAVAPLAERLTALCRAGYADQPPLGAFIDGSFAVRPVSRRSVTTLSQTQHEVIDGGDIERLLHCEGDVVTVVGRIAATQQRWSRQRRPYVSVALGPDAKNGAALLLWSQALNFFMPVGQSIAAYDGRWVRATGLVSITHRRDAARTPRPMVTINLSSDIQLVSEADAWALIDGAGLPWYRDRQRRSEPPRPVSAAAAAALNRLYGGPPPQDQVPAAAQAAPKKARIRRRPTKQPAPAPVPAAPQVEWWRTFRPSSLIRRATTTPLAALSRAVASQIVKLTLVVAALATLTGLLAARLILE